ncbi:hypothetical protein NKJ74_29735, partial [Mesorhizobium sp. M0046]|uniref:hypothetical protein n=1 Tax=Mesorhizobium sp. M0046 TaxID=2956858 RepID=UPI003336B6AA
RCDDRTRRMQELLRKRRIRFRQNVKDSRDAKGGASRRAIGQRASTFLRGAMCAAVDDVILFDAMSDDPASAMRTRRCKFLDRAFEAVERVGLVGHRHVESLIVVIPALIASGHSSFPSFIGFKLDQPVARR